MRETSHMESFVKIKPSRNDKITLSFIDTGKSCLNRQVFSSPMCVSMQFTKIKFSRNFLNLQYLFEPSLQNHIVLFMFSVLDCQWFSLFLSTEHF